MRILHSDDHFWITGRGPALTFEHNPALDLWDPRDLVDEWVMIDGGLFQIAGVEMRLVMISPGQPYGDRAIGLLVRDRTELPEGYFG